MASSSSFRTRLRLAVTALLLTFRFSDASLHLWYSNSNHHHEEEATTKRLKEEENLIVSAAASSLGSSGVCRNLLQGAARDACVSFCQVKECHKLEGADDDSAYCEQLRNFLVKKTNGDLQAFPCEPCPCWQAQELDDFVKKHQHAMMCFKSDYYDELVSESDPHASFLTQSKTPQKKNRRPNHQSKRLTCMNLAKTPNVIAEMSEREAAACRTQLRSVCNQQQQLVPFSSSGRDFRLRMDDSED